MPGAKQLERTLEELAALRGDPRAPAALKLLRKVLSGRSAHAVAKAAEIVGEAEIDELAEPMVGAFERFLEKPVKTDPNCVAKEAIAEALYRMGAAEYDLYLKGIRHVQMEPVWGGKVDTAPSLRGTCALGLVRTHYPEYLTEIAELLADRETTARSMAARALGYSGSSAAVPLLRLKALIGDEEPQVLSDVLSALLEVAPDASLEFLNGFLDRPQVEVAEAAALALGASRLPKALPILKSFWERTIESTLRSTALLAIATLRSEPGIEYLVTIANEEDPIHARAAIRALAVFRHDKRIRDRVEAILAQRGDQTLCSTFEEVFGDLIED